MITHFRPHAIFPILCVGTILCLRLNASAVPGHDAQTFRSVGERRGAIQPIRSSGGDLALDQFLLHPHDLVARSAWRPAGLAVLSRSKGKREPALDGTADRSPDTAIIPAPRCEPDAVGWEERHDAIKALIKVQPVDLVFIGDSITNFFGGQPVADNRTGQAVWEHYYGGRNPINLGFGWDRTQQALWRLKNGEFDGIHPKVAVVMIGTNNLISHAVRGNTDPEIVAGIGAVCSTIHTMSPATRILLLGIFPREEQPNTEIRVRIRRINRRLAALRGRANVTYLDIGNRFLDRHGIMLPGVMVDFLHPTEKGYHIWAEAMEPTLAKLFAEDPR